MPNANESVARGGGSAEHRLAERHGRGEITVWEQLVALASAGLVAAVFGFLGWEIVRKPEGPPTLRVQVVGRIEPSGGAFRVGFEAFNAGSTTATALEVIGRLERVDGATVEESRATLDYVPPGSSRAGGLFFGRDPRLFTLVLRPGGYADP